MSRLQVCFPPNALSSSTSSRSISSDVGPFSATRRPINPNPPPKPQRSSIPPSFTPSSPSQDTSTIPYIRPLNQKIKLSPPPPKSFWRSYLGKLPTNPVERTKLILDKQAFSSKYKIILGIAIGIYAYTAMRTQDYLFPVKEDDKVESPISVQVIDKSKP